MTKNELFKFVQSGFARYFHKSRADTGKNNDIFKEKETNNSESLGNLTANIQENQPKRREKVDPVQIVDVTYGHRGSGRLYSYYAVNRRMGDVVTPEVTNWRSGKTYKTLAVVQSVKKVENAEDTINYLTGRGIPIKTIGRTNQRSLPGYYTGWGTSQ